MTLKTLRLGGQETRRRFTPVRSLPSAFTLAESLFAMAIVSFTILSIIGMMPGGLTELRAAERRSAEARILHSLSNEFQTKPIADLSRVPPDVRYFDVAGAELAGKTLDAVFAARVQPVADADALKLPGETSPNPYVRHLRVLVTERVNDPAALSLQERGRVGRREFSIVITDMEPDQDDGIKP